jgi:hypothetical protein
MPPLLVRLQRQEKHAAAVALGAPPWRARSGVDAAAGRKQNRDGLLAAAEQVAVNLVHQAARESRVHAGAQQDEDQAGNQQIPTDQAPANTREQALHDKPIYSLMV